MLDVQFAYLSDTGLVREHNEDMIGTETDIGPVRGIPPA